jgi:DNA modification methylase
VKSISFVTGDACNLDIKSSSIDLIITSPPYFGVDPFRYGGNSKNQINNDLNKMLKLLIKSTKEMSRVLKPNGSILINVGDKDMPYHYVSEVIKKTDLKLANKPFVWEYEDFKNISSVKREGFNNTYEFWFHFSKNPETLYHNPFVVKKYSNPIWSIPLNEDDEVVKKAEEYGFIKDSFNSEIPRRFITMFSKEGANVLDPFGGSGATAIQAYKNGRNGLSIDISPDQTRLAKKRFEIEIEHGG